MKLKVPGWKQTPVQVLSCTFCYTFKNRYVVVHVRTAASDIILGYRYAEISSARSTLKKCTVFSSILVFIYFKLILESCTTSGVYLKQYQTSMMKLLVVLFSWKRSIIDIWQGSKYGFASSFFITFPLSLYMNIFFSSKSLQLLCSCDANQKYTIFHWFPNFPLYWLWKYQIFIYLYDREAKKLTLKNFKMDCKADIYY